MKRELRDYVFYMLDGTVVHLIGTSPKLAFDRKYKTKPQPQYVGYDVSKVPLRLWNVAHKRWERRPRGSLLKSKDG